jgi:hypothetical protein
MRFSGYNAAPCDLCNLSSDGLVIIHLGNHLIAHFRIKIANNLTRLPDKPDTIIGNLLIRQPINDQFFTLLTGCKGAVSLAASCYEFAIKLHHIPPLAIIPGVLFGASITGSFKEFQTTTHDAKEI